MNEQMRRIITLYLKLNLCLLVFLVCQNSAQSNESQAPEKVQPASSQSPNGTDRFDLSVGAGFFVKEGLRTEAKGDRNNRDFDSMTNNGPIVTVEATFNFKGYSYDVIEPFAITFLNSKGRGESETNTNGPSLTGSTQESIDDRQTRFLDLDLTYAQAQLSFEHLETGLGYGSSLRVSPIHIDAITAFTGAYIFAKFVNNPFTGYLRVMKTQDRCHQADDASIQIATDDLSELLLKYNAFTCEESDDSPKQISANDDETVETHRTTELRYTRDLANPLLGEKTKWRWFIAVNSMNSRYYSVSQDQNETTQEKIYEHFKYGGGLEAKIY